VFNVKFVSINSHDVAEILLKLALNTKQFVAVLINYWLINCIFIKKPFQFQSRILSLPLSLVVFLEQEAAGFSKRFVLMYIDV